MQEELFPVKLQLGRGRRKRAPNRKEEQELEPLKPLRTEWTAERCTRESSFQGSLIPQSMDLREQGKWTVGLRIITTAAWEVSLGRRFTTITIRIRIINTELRGRRWGTTIRIRMHINRPTWEWDKRGRNTATKCLQGREWWTITTCNSLSSSSNNNHLLCRLTIRITISPRGCTNNRELRLVIKGLLVVSKCLLLRMDNSIPRHHLLLFITSSNSNNREFLRSVDQFPEEEGDQVQVVRNSPSSNNNLLMVTTGNPVAAPFLRLP